MTRKNRNARSDQQSTANAGTGAGLQRDDIAKSYSSFSALQRGRIAEVVGIITQRYGNESIPSWYTRALDACMTSALDPDSFYEQMIARLFPQMPLARAATPSGMSESDFAAFAQAASEVIREHAARGELPCLATSAGGELRVERTPAIGIGADDSFVFMTTILPQLVRNQHAIAATIGSFVHLSVTDKPSATAVDALAILSTDRVHDTLELFQIRLAMNGSTQFEPLTVTAFEEYTAWLGALHAGLT